VLFAAVSGLPLGLNRRHTAKFASGAARTWCLGRTLTVPFAKAEVAFERLAASCAAAPASYRPWLARPAAATIVVAGPSTTAQACLACAAAAEGWSLAKLARPNRPSPGHSSRPRTRKCALPSKFCIDDGYRAPHAVPGAGALRGVLLQELPEKIVLRVAVTQVLAEALAVSDAGFAAAAGTPIAHGVDVLVHAMVLAQPFPLTGVGR